MQQKTYSERGAAQIALDLPAGTLLKLLERTNDRVREAFLDETVLLHSAQ